MVEKEDFKVFFQFLATSYSKNSMPCSEKFLKTYKHKVSPDFIKHSAGAVPLLPIKSLHVSGNLSAIFNLVGHKHHHDATMYNYLGTNNKVYMKRRRGERS